MFEVFAAYLSEKGNLDEAEIAIVEKVAITKKLHKREYLLEEGKVSTYNCFVAKGCLRLYRIGQDGSEHILRFAVENWWMADYESYNSDQPSKGFIDALEDSDLVLILRQDFDALCDAIPKFQQLRDRLQARSYDASQNRVLSNISYTAEEQYDNFIKSYPEFYRRIPLHMIASYLGVSRETLSRARLKYGHRKM
jgi:CRP-like cAMP-binding protein